MRKKLLAILVLAITITGSVIAGILPPLVLEQIVNRLTKNEILSMSMILMYFLLLAVAGLLDAAKESMITVFGQKVTHDIRSRMCHKLDRLTTEYYSQHDAGTITSRFVNDVDTVETLFDSGVVSMIADGAKVISILVIIFTKSRGLGILMLIVTPLLMLYTRHVQRKMLVSQVERRVAVGEANRHIPETIDNIRMIHTFHGEAYMKNKYGSCIRKGYEAMEQSNFYDAIYSPIIITVSAMMISTLMICATMSGEMQSFFGISVGTAVAVISYVSKVFEPLESIGMEIQNIQSALAGMERIREFMKEKERPLVHENAIYDTSQPAIVFSNVDFGYTPNQQVLHDMNLIVRSSENCTLIGRTGAGKSTAFKLLLGMYPLWKGSIEIYGIPVDEMSDQDRAEMIGYVEQTYHSVPGNVQEQITLGDTGVTEAQVWHACQVVGIQEAISHLPQGLNTPYSSQLFSQGQMQLISIARAIVHDPPILLLDEITANLDSITEQMVLKALKEASVNRTVLSISHRVYERYQDDYTTCMIS